MNSLLKNNVIKIFLLGCCLIVNHTLHAQTSNSNVVLNPGYITGTIQIGDREILRAGISASFGEYSASTVIRNTSGQPSINYSLTVNVPEGAVADYSLNICEVNYDPIFPPNPNAGSDRICFQPRQVAVREFETSKADFNIHNPGFITGIFTVTGGGEFVSGNLAISPRNADNPASYIRSGAVAGIGAGYHVLAPPGRYSFGCGGRVKVGTRNEGVSGKPSVRLFTLQTGETVTINCDLTTPLLQLGSVSGRLQFPGNGQLDNHFVNLQSLQNLPTQRLTEDGPYAFNDIPAGNYRLYAVSRFDQNQRRFNFPLASFSPLLPANRRISVAGGDSLTFDIYAEQAEIAGRINILGPGRQYVSRTSSSLIVEGIIGSITEGGSSSDRQIIVSDNGIGAFRLIVSEGPWRIERFGLNFYNNVGSVNEYINSILYVNEAPNKAITAAAVPNATVDVGDITFATGMVTVQFRIAGNTATVFSNPIIEGECELSNELGLQHRFWVRSSNGQTNVETGVVNLIGLEGECQLSARALVNGSDTSFGQLNVSVVPGATQVVDIGGPTLSVGFPEPDLITSDESITITGVVTDDIAVSTVTVNGVAADLVSTNNPIDPNEYSYTATVALTPGANTLTIVASDTSTPANNSSDTRMIYRDNAAPTLNWTPIDSSVFETTETSITVQVEGLANDDTGIASITVNGAPVDFNVTHNSTEPNEVSFSLPLQLALGDHFISVIATDLSGRNTQQIHRVTIGQPNVAPVANAGADQVLEQQGPDGTLVSLNGSASFDADGDSLSFVWQGPFGLQSGIAPTVLVPAGTHEILLTVSDAELSSQDLVVITVRDTIAPIITAPANIVIEATAALTAVELGEATATDAVGVTNGPNPDRTGPFALGSHSVNWLASDAAGNVGTAPQTVTVQDTTPPDFTFKQIRKNLWPPNRKLVLAAVVCEVHDLVDPDPVATIGVSANQPINDPGSRKADYRIAHDAEQDCWNIFLRAKRWQRFDDDDDDDDEYDDDDESDNQHPRQLPRIYSVKVQIIDASGNTALATHQFTVNNPYQNNDDDDEDDDHEQDRDDDYESRDDNDRDDVRRKKYKRRDRDD